MNTILVGLIICTIGMLLSLLLWWCLRIRAFKPESQVRPKRTPADPNRWLQGCEIAPDPDPDVQYRARASPFQWHVSRSVRIEMGGMTLKDTAANRAIAAQKVSTHLALVQGLRQYDRNMHHPIILSMVFIPGKEELLARQLQASEAASERRILFRQEHYWRVNPFTWFWQAVRTDPEPGEAE